MIAARTPSPERDSVLDNEVQREIRKKGRTERKGRAEVGGSEGRIEEIIESERRWEEEGDQEGRTPAGAA